jgi:glycosyltransferase involved in cell wall biosynthesis
MNILYVSSKKRWGGVSSWMNKTALALENRGHRVVVVAHPEGRFATVAGGLQVIPRKLGMDYNPLAILFLARLIQRLHIQLVVTNIEKEVIAGGIAARMTRIPNVRRVGREDDFNEKLKVKWHHRLLVDRCIVPCDRVRENAMKRAGWLDAAQFTTIYNGKNARDFSKKDRLHRRRRWGVAEEDFVVGVTSQLSVQKGIDRLIEVFEELNRRGPERPLYLVIHGEGKERERLQQMVQARGLSNRVVFAGFTADPVAAAAAYDIAVSPSIFEGFPNSVVEYFAAGRPVVTTDAGGVTEMAVHGENALVVPVGADRRLRNAIEELIHDRSLRERLGSNARRTIDQGFSEDHMIDRLECFFKESLKPDPERSV